MARASTPRDEKPLSGSSHAGVRIASPDATAHSHWSFCAAFPPRRQHAPAQHGTHEMRDRSQGAPQLLVEGHTLDQ